MKRHIIAMAGFAFFAAGAANASDVKVLFDGPSGTSVNTYLQERADQEKAGPKAGEPAINAAPAAPYRGRLVLVKNLLSGLSAGERVELMSGMRIADGNIFPADRAALIDKGLPASRVDAVLKPFIASAARTEGMTDSNGGIELGALLKDLPEEARLEFIESMRVLDGKVASVKTGQLGATVPAERAEQIIQSVLPSVVNGAAVRSVVKNATCEAWIFNDRTIEYGCSSTEDSTCDSSVCK